MSKKIPLSQGKFAIVDDEDYEYLNQWKWSIVSDSINQYAIRRLSTSIDKKRRTIRMHRLVLDVIDKKLVVDHINGNTLDNRKSNLRVCTQLENNKNVNKIKSNNKTGYKGVLWHKRDRIYEAFIGLNGKRIYLGRFHDIIEAVKAYNEAALKYHGEFARLNII